MIDVACRDWLIERRSVASCDHVSKISRSQQSLLIEMAIGIVERWKKSMGSRLCSHAQESHTSLFFLSLFFFLPHLQDHATMATERNDFSFLLL